MLTIYLVSTEEKAEQNEYKFGKHKGSISKLLSRYRTYLIKPIIYFYCKVNDNKLIESSVLNVLKKYRMRDENDRATEWIKLELSKILEVIISILNGNDNIFEKKIIEEEEKNEDIKIIPFGDKINMEYELDEITSALNEHKNPCIGLLRLLHFDENKRENHNIYRSMTGKGHDTIYTTNGIEKSNDTIGQLSGEIKKFVQIIKQNHESKMKSKARDLLEKAREIIYCDSKKYGGYSLEQFINEVNYFHSTEIPLLLYNKRKIAANTINKL